jgi:hypothetical protein
MDRDRQLAVHLKRLHRAIQRLVARSKDFAKLRTLLKAEQMQLAVYVIPLVSGVTSGREPRTELTDEDLRFLKAAGIRYE